MKEPEARRNFDERNERKRHKSMLFRGIVTFLFAFDFFFQKSPRHKRENLYQKSFLELEVISDLFSLVLIKLIKSSVILEEIKNALLLFSIILNLSVD